MRYTENQVYVNNVKLNVTCTENIPLEKTLFISRKRNHKNLLEGKRKRKKDERREYFR